MHDSVRSITCIGSYVLCAVQQQENDDLVRMQGHMIAMEAPLYQSYRVYIINRVRAKTEIHLGKSLCRLPSSCGNCHLPCPTTTLSSALTDWRFCHDKWYLGRDLNPELLNMPCKCYLCDLKFEEVQSKLLAKKYLKQLWRWWSMWDLKIQSSGMWCHVIRLVVPDILKALVPHSSRSSKYCTWDFQSPGMQHCGTE
jgi:hypothetical protein